MAPTRPLATPPHERLITVDVLRGFALFGILYAHMVAWYTAGPLPQELFERFQSVPTGIAFGVNVLFVMGKFFSVFAFLFGLSFTIQINNLARHGDNVALRFGWRLALLGLIAAVHHMLWRGDILSIYVPLGFLLIFARHLSNKALLVLGAVLVLNLPTKVFELVALLRTGKVDFIASDPVKEGAAYFEFVKNSGFVDMLLGNLQAFGTKIDYQLTSGRLLITFGFFLLGMLVGRLGWFDKAEAMLPTVKTIWKRSWQVMLVSLLLGLVIGGAAMALSLKLEDRGWPYFAAEFAIDAYNAACTVFYISGIALLMARPGWARRLAPLADVGKMALTSYLTQTLFGLLIFYSFGLALFAQTSPAVNVLICLAIFAFQIAFSRWWLGRFHYGPVEWLWRSATFFKWQPLVKG
ncbi:DUF418 domain-containing protein [Roseateles sp. LYH14W]|uniref:DUF418 domain-containing protein n=1 Tax=Pelomonas parva TaxID=3299032 RepID=A0ABW7F8K6_9BURK